MGLPVHQIFATLEEQMQILDEEPAGDPEEELDDEGQGADDLSEMKVELVEGDHGVNWLVVDGVHILHKKREYPNEIKWRCSGFYNFKCPFILSTKEKDGEVVVVKMADPMVHVCSQEKVGVIMHKFKLRLRERMTSNLDEGFAKIWSEERSKLLESLKDQPELTNQVLLEMKDSRSFRVAAQRARGKQTPPIPRDHQAMDPEKVQHKLELFCFIGSLYWHTHNIF